MESKKDEELEPDHCACACACVRAVSQTFQVALGDALQPVSLQQQQREVLQVLKSSAADAADVVVGQSQLFESSRQVGGDRRQLVVVGKEVGQPGLVPQDVRGQPAAGQLVVIQDEPA